MAGVIITLGFFILVGFLVHTWSKKEHLRMTLERNKEETNEEETKKKGKEHE